LAYVSGNAPTKAEVLGTWMLSALSGHKRYSHVTTIRCDGVNPGLLGMRRVISEDALRRALAAVPEDEGVAWLDGHLSESVAPLLDAPWILDIDTTVKPLYGKQEGAVVSYNPKKPGRPSHSYHTYLMAGLRLVVGAEVKAGNERHIERIFWDAGWRDAGQGWEGKDGELRLSGWDTARRVVVLRRPLQGEVLITQDDNGQGLLGFIEADRKTGKRTTGYEYEVLVTNLDHEIISLGQVYRDRADAENAYDELKNQ
jgi:hypothetical protein